MGGLIGKLVVKKRHFFTERLQREYSNSKTNLIIALEKATHVSTTEDMWTAHRRSFLGMTVHWIGSDLQRRSACLAVRRVIGSHTHDVIAAAIDSVHKEFGIASKVNCTITDNGSNFLKAFKVFSCSSSTDPIEEERENSQDFDFQEDVDADEDFVYIDIGDIFEKYSKECEAQQATASESSDDENVAAMHTKRIKLPKHIRCSCHLLNLIATTDINNINNVAFKKMKKRIDAKLQKIWNKQSRSSLASDHIKDKLGIIFVLYNTTRWNSFYDAVECVTKLIEKKTRSYQNYFFISTLNH